MTGQTGATEYTRLFKQIEALAEPSEGFHLATLAAASAWLEQAVLAEITGPCMSWHGRDAIVLFWTQGQATLLMTLSEDNKVSVLKEENGVITERCDSIPLESVKQRVLDFENGVISQ